MCAVTEDQIAILRGQLAGAASPGERLSVLAEIVDLAVARPGDAPARSALDQALPALETVAESADDDGDYLMALYVFAQACLARDGEGDLDNAIGALRELRDALGEDPPEPEQGGEHAQLMVEIDTKLGMALSERASRPDGAVADVDGASQALMSALARMTPGDDRRPMLTGALALQHALRYAGCAGTEEDRRSALALAAEVLVWPGAADDAMAGCHLVTAWMTLTRQMTAEQRSAMLDRFDIDAMRRGGPEDVARVTALGEISIDPSDAEAALVHLRQIPGHTSLAGDLPTIASTLSSVALLVMMRAGQAGQDIDRVAEELLSASEQDRPDPIESGELLAIRAELLAARACSGGNLTTGQAAPGGLAPSIDALQKAASGLPEGHVFRSGLFGLLQQSLRQEVRGVEQAGSAEDIAAELGRVMDVLEQMPSDDPQFARTLTFATVNVLAAETSHRGTVPLDRIVRQLEQSAHRLAPDDPMKIVGEAMHWAAVAFQATVEHQPDQVQAATTLLVNCADRIPVGDTFRPLILLIAAGGFKERYVMTGERHLLKQAGKLVVLALTAIGEAEAAAGDPGVLSVLGMMRGLAIYLQVTVDIGRRQHDMKGQDLTAMVAELDRACKLMGPLDSVRSRMIADLETIRALGEILTSSSHTTSPGQLTPALGPAEREAFEKILAEVRSISRDHHDFPLLSAQAAAGLMMRGIVDGDTAAMGQAISLLAEGCSVPGLTYRERPRMLDQLGVALLTRHSLTRDPRDLSNAIDRLEEARRAVEQELGSPYTADVLQSLASAYRTRGDAARGDVDRAVVVGLGALREHAGDVLLQDSDENALAAARRMTGEAAEMARWFLRRDRATAAIEALEFGRGTVLHAATSGARLAEVLKDAGHADLADEWAHHISDGGAPPEAADDLRYRIMMAIEGSQAEARLLAPPSRDEITAALRARAADALVYLLPGGEAGPGLALLVDSSGSVTPRSLPGLRTGPGTPVGSFLQARGAGPDGQAASADWREVLDELCDWAWRVAIGPVLDTTPGRARGPGRIVLVPGEKLGLVAWHAARRHTPAGYRYATQEAAFSYASSARQFVEVARHRPRPWPESPVLISDANASAYATEMGICQLHASHYPQARVFGHAHTRLARPGLRQVHGKAAGRAEDVLAVLPHGTDPGASMVHFGCHGQAELPVLDSKLNLGGGNKLAVQDILQQARRKTAQVSGGLVVLASCLTDVAEADYDEALTLATAFVSAGAAGVVAARWKVPDPDTALFMAAFHHYLNGNEREPVRAVRSAQLWMLDPDRQQLGPLPTVLSDEVTRAGLADPVAWAGFAYQGW